MFEGYDLLYVIVSKFSSLVSNLSKVLPISIALLASIIASVEAAELDRQNGLPLHSILDSVKQQPVGDLHELLYGTLQVVTIFFLVHLHATSYGYEPSA